MSDTYNLGPIKNQLNNPVIHGNVVIYNGQHTYKRILTKLPKPDDQVIGRERDIQVLKEALESAQKVVLMNGLGGIGKTTTAMAFVQTYKDKNKYAHIAWLEHLTDFSTDTASNKLLTTNLGIQPTNDTVADTQLILNTLSNLSGPSLLVIDNAYQSLQVFKDFLPQAPNWQVLITSRQELAFRKIIKLGFLNEKAALELFYSHYDENRDRDDEAVKRIFSAIDYHTLTIELLAKTAEKLRIAPLTKLADLLAERGIKIGRKLNISTAHSGEEQVKQLFPYLKAIFQLDDAMTEREKWLLKQFIGLPPSFISFELLCDLLQINQDQEEEYDEFISALEQLKLKGWLNRDVGQEAYKMHRIVQEVMLAHLKPSFEDLKVLRENVSSCLKVDPNNFNQFEKFPFLPFGERILDVFIKEKDEYISRVQNLLGWIYEDKGDYKKAKEHYSKALVCYQSMDNEYPVGVAMIECNLATVQQHLGELLQAKSLLQKAIISVEKYCGIEHRNTTTVYSNLASVLSDLGELHEAKKLLIKVISSDEKSFGTQHPNTSNSYSNLGIVLHKMGELQQAKDLFYRSIASDEMTFGTKHPNTAIRYSNLALVLKDLGYYQHAVTYLRKTCNVMLGTFTQKHPHFQRALENFNVTVDEGVKAGDEYCLRLKEEMGKGNNNN